MFSHKQNKHVKYSILLIIEENNVVHLGIFMNIKKNKTSGLEATFIHISWGHKWNCCVFHLNKN